MFGRETRMLLRHYLEQGKTYALLVVLGYSRLLWWDVVFADHRLYEFSFQRRFIPLRSPANGRDCSFLCISLRWFF